jgi:hypothetical protein
MAWKAESAAVSVAGPVQGIALFKFPTASTISTDPPP